MWRVKQQRKAELNVNVIDDKWKDRFFLSFIVLVRLVSSFICCNTKTRISFVKAVAAFVAQTYDTRRRAFADATDRPRHSLKPDRRASEPQVALALSIDGGKGN